MRVIIVDFNHMVYNMMYGGHRLSIRVMENGEPVEKDTTIHNGTIKNIFRWSNKGYNPTAVCFDRPVKSRKAFFQENMNMPVGTDKEYKGGRERMSGEMFEAIADVEKMLRSAGVSCFAQPNYEADDLIFACVQRAKEKYPGVPIDVITNDADLLPLVDDTVSVFIRSKKGTFAEFKGIEKNHYIQVTPKNFQTVVEDLSAYKGFCIPYNSLLLHKLLRGDSSDNFQRKDISRMFSAKKYNEFVSMMIRDDTNFEEVFRYGIPQYKILYKGTDKEFDGTLEEALESPDKGNLYQKISNSEELDAILWLLKKYTTLDEEQLSAIEKIYWGMNLNQAYPNSTKELSRKPYVVGKYGNPDIEKFDTTALRSVCSTLRIQLPM